MSLTFKVGHLTILHPKSSFSSHTTLQSLPAFLRTTVVKRIRKESSENKFTKTAIKKLNMNSNQIVNRLFDQLVTTAEIV